MVKIDFENLEEYKENNRLEAKRALGGLPHSIWETYSAFANTLGGVILLGVEEKNDHTFQPVDLPNPQLLIDEFWEIINDQKLVSANILGDEDVYILKVKGRHIIVIQVPCASDVDRPVYVEGNPFHAYYRSGDGDYLFSKEEIQRMVCEASLEE